ncbi:hypothetical protein ACHHYP_05525 [Achlya hypogyna]|uniref:Uncharacterized protein n=1 Tax=Achlya hypogyna TaxID=1202772 RepID=A0A1V9YXJ0_ACHHY|nr:hypothetical protein ACHHYP_05525 [Achlya hypogyna]
MGAAASVARKYRVPQAAAHGWNIAILRYHALLDEAHRRGLNRQEFDALVQRLRQRHLQLLAAIHVHMDPLAAKIRPYIDKYEPVVRRQVRRTICQIEVVYNHIDYVVTTTTLQAIYQARRQVVSQLSDATISSYFGIPIGDVLSIHVAKRRFTIKNAGCDLREHEIEHRFAIDDMGFIKKMLELQWVPWHPTPSIATKLTETFVLDIAFFARNEFAIKTETHVALRVGPKWVGEDVRRAVDTAHPRWLQRIDFHEREQRSTLFYDLLRHAYDQMHDEWTNAEIAAAAAAAAAAKMTEAAKAQARAPALSVLTPEMIRRTLTKCSKKILEEDKHRFYTLSSYENWRMELQDTLRCGQTIGEICEEDAMMHEDELLRLYARRVIEGAERVRMEAEDVNRAITKEEMATIAMQVFDVDIESDWENDSDDDL